jgi:D-alanyl-D-alanine carboxypeptidase
VKQRPPPQDGYGLASSTSAGGLGTTAALPGYQTVVVYLPQKQTTLVILINTDGEYQGGEASTALASAITK